MRPASTATWTASGRHGSASPAAAAIRGPARGDRLPRDGAPSPSRSAWQSRAGASAGDAVSTARTSATRSPATPSSMAPASAAGCGTGSGRSAGTRKQRPGCLVVLPLAAPERSAALARGPVLHRIEQQLRLLQRRAGARRLPPLPQQLAQRGRRPGRSRHTAACAPARRAPRAACARPTRSRPPAATAERLPHATSLRDPRVVGAAPATGRLAAGMRRGFARSPPPSPPDAPARTHAGARRSSIDAVWNSQPRRCGRCAYFSMSPARPAPDRSRCAAGVAPLAASS